MIYLTMIKVMTMMIKLNKVVESLESKSLSRSNKVILEDDNESKFSWFTDDVLNKIENYCYLNNLTCEYSESDKSMNLKSLKGSVHDIDTKLDITDYESEDSLISAIDNLLVEHSMRKDD